LISQMPGIVPCFRGLAACRAAGDWSLSSKGRHLHLESPIAIVAVHFEDIGMRLLIRDERPTPADLPKAQDGAP
jgi:hypothetical protein